MNYTVRPAGPRTGKQKLQFCLEAGGFIFKWIAALMFAFLALIAALTANFGALSVLMLIFILTGLSLNLFKLRAWLPGWKNNSWFVRVISLCLYVFTALSVLLVTTPRP